MVRPYISLVGGLAKYLCNVHSSSCRVTGLERFLQLLEDEKRRGQGRGVLTYANHISVIDDPGIFGALPMRTFQNAATTRWTLGASDILFTNRLFSLLFNSGQVISTDRGRGIFQPALDTAIAKLEQGQWVHLFPEGYVNLSRRMVLRRFKWGVSRLLLEAEKRPRVVPIWIQGFDQMMPDPRSFPGFVPRPFANLCIHFGEPIDRLGSALDLLLNDLRSQAWLNPRFWSSENQHIEWLKQQGAAEEGGMRIEEAPSIPIPSPGTFPRPEKPIAVPSGGWPGPPADSRAAEALRATVAHPEGEAKAMEARSQLVEVLRRELAFLGARDRKEMGEDPGEVGRLVHRLVAEDDEDKGIASK